MKIKKELYDTLSNLILNVEPILNKTRLDNTETKRNVLNCLERVKELKEILEQQDYNSSKKFKQSSFFK